MQILFIFTHFQFPNNILFLLIDYILKAIHIFENRKYFNGFCKEKYFS